MCGAIDFMEYRAVRTEYMVRKVNLQEAQELPKALFLTRVYECLPVFRSDYLEHRTTTVCE